MTVVELNLPCREPFDGGALLAFLGTRAVAGVERVDGSSYRRSLALAHGGGEVELKPGPGAIRCRLWLDDAADRDAAVASCRRLLDLDADPAAIVAGLGGDAVLGELVRGRPGLRVPRCVDGFELAVRAVVGQQVTVAAARTILGRLVATHGEPLGGDGEPPGGAREPLTADGEPRRADGVTRRRPAGDRLGDGVTHRFPTPAVLAEVDPAALPFPRGRGLALRTLARLVCDGELDLGADADPQAARATLLGIRGIGGWTASYISMRALMDPDAWLSGDVGIRNALERLAQPSDERTAHTLAEGWRPWRSYAVMHLWGSLGRTAEAARA